MGRRAKTINSGVRKTLLDRPNDGWGRRKNVLEKKFFFAVPHLVDCPASLTLANSAIPCQNGERQKCNWTCGGAAGWGQKKRSPNGEKGVGGSETRAIFFAAGEMKKRAGWCLFEFLRPERKKRYARTCYVFRTAAAGVRTRNSSPLRHHAKSRIKSDRIVDFQQGRFPPTTPKLPFYRGSKS